MTSTIKIFILFLALFSVNSMFAQSIPKYAALVGVKGSGTIKKGEFLAQQGVVGMRRITIYHWEPVTVDSFYIIILRDTSQIIFFKN